MKKKTYVQTTPYIISSCFSPPLRLLVPLPLLRNSGQTHSGADATSETMEVEDVNGAVTIGFLRKFGWF